MKYSINSLFLLFIFLFLVSCGTKKNIELIGEDIAGMDTRINRVLVNKYAFEKATIKIRGKVKNLTEQSEEKSIKFELTDRKGNYINIVTDKDTDIQETDFIILNGEYNSADNILILDEYEIYPIN